jgi:hypothetical protein
MKFTIQTCCFTLLATLASAGLAQSPVLTEASGRVIGRVGSGDTFGTVLIGTGNQTMILRVSREFPPNLRSSGLIWSSYQINYTGPGCSGTAYFSYKGSVYGQRRLVVPSKQGTQWLAFVAAQNFVIVPEVTILSNLYEGQCTNNASPRIENELVAVEYTFPLNRVGVPPFFIK